MNLINMASDKFAIFQIILVVSIISFVNGKRRFKVDDAVDIKIYIIPGFPGEFPTGYDSTDIDKHASHIGEDKSVIEMAKESGFDIGLNAGKYIRNEVKSIQDRVKDDEKGLHTYDPKTHLAKTIEKARKSEDEDTSAYLEGVGNQNVISKAISHHGNAHSVALGHGTGDAIAISGDKDPSEVMKAFKDFFKRSANFITVGPLYFKCTNLLENHRMNKAVVTHDAWVLYTIPENRRLSSKRNISYLENSTRIRLI